MAAAAKLLPNGQAEPSVHVRGFSQYRVSCTQCYWPVNNERSVCGSSSLDPRSYVAFVLGT